MVNDIISLPIFTYNHHHHHRHHYQHFLQHRHHHHHQYHHHFHNPLPRFVSLLSQLEIEQAEQGGAMERFLDMHMYITSALQKTDMKAVGLQLALELLHQKVTS